MCEYVIQFDSRHGCPSNANSGSAGRLLLLLLFGVVVYCAAGSMRHAPCSSMSPRALPDSCCPFLPLFGGALSHERMGLLWPC